MVTEESVQERFYEKIYIIESPNPKDIESNRNEGNALNAALTLASLNSRYFSVSSKHELETSLSAIAKDIEKTRGSKVSIPFLHFSVHGNEEGIALTNGDFIQWEILRGWLLILNHNVKFVNSYNRICSRFYLSMSVCKGINAKKMFYPLEQLNPFSVLIGPNNNIDWSDSLVAYITYFHNLIYKRTLLKEAVLRMNIATGLNNTFEIFLDYQLKLI